MQRWHVPNSIGVMLVFLSLLCVNTVIASEQNQSAVQRLDVVVESKISHENSSWTQGLLIKDGYLYESTGKYGESSLQKVNMSNGEVEKIFNHNESIFAEGLTFYENKLIQLTYLSNIAFVFDIDTFEIVNTLNYTGEGWGICTMSDYYVMSNGTNQLGLRDLVTFELLDVVNVTKNGTPLLYLNELECVEDKVYSNVWLTDEIVLIDIITGNVTNTINAEGLLNKSEYTNADVLNGIAYNEDDSKFWITGKYWPHFYKVTFVINETASISDITNDVQICIKEKNGVYHYDCEDEELNIFDSSLFINSLILFFMVCIIILLIDLKMRQNSEKTQVKDGGGEYDG